MTISEIRVSQLWIYPIKSLAGISLASVTMDNKGFLFDRQWMLVDEQGVFISQRKFPKLARFSVTSSADSFIVSYPDKGSIKIAKETSLESESLKTRVTIWKDQCLAYQINHEFDQWFSEILEYSCRLVFLPGSSKRLVDTQYAHQHELTRFTDGFPLLLISQASLDDLNNRLEKKVDMRNFRPNLVVSGGEAYQEDSWSSFTIEKVNFSVVKPCSRCIVTTVDPDSGIRSSKEPLKTLSTYRKENNKVFFGQNLLFKFSSSDIECDSIRLGDTLIFTESN